MSWFNVWDGLKNKTCRYLLQRYLGQFLEERINLEQLKIELYSGKATLKNVSLKVDALNDLFESQGWAVEVISGHIGTLTVTVPWNALMTNDSSIEVSDMVISLRPIKRQNDGTSMLESMWSSVSSSMQLAEECMKQKDEYVDEHSDMNSLSIAGLEKFAETIDNVLNRIKAQFNNTKLILEYPSTDCKKGIAIIMKIQDLNYKNETECARHSNINSTHSDDFANENMDTRNTNTNENIHLLPIFAKHNITIMGLKLFTEEFMFRDNSKKVSEPLEHQTSEGSNSTKILMVDIKGQQKIQIKIKQSEDINGPKVCLDVELGSIYLLVTPRQIHLVFKVWDAFYEDASMSNAKFKEGRDRRQSSRKEDFNNFQCHKFNMAGSLNDQTNCAVNFGEPRISHNTSENVYFDTYSTKSDKYCNSISTSMSSSSTITGTTRFQRKTANMESCDDILHFNIRVALFEGRFLHEDILIESSLNESNSPLNETSQLNMLDIANNFFTSLLDDFSKLGSNPDKNHIFVSLVPIFAEGIQQRNKKILLQRMSLTATKVDVSEVLDGKISPLILFDRNENCSEGYHKRPELTITLKSSFSCYLKEMSTTTLDVCLEKCLLEMDISIYDRLSGTLGPSPFMTNFPSNYKIEKKHANCEKKFEESVKSSVEINLVSRTVDLKLRFPIADARPIHDPNRVPWWKQNIRKDFLLFTLNQVNIKFCGDILNILANEIEAFYCERNMEQKVSLLKANLAKNVSKYSAEPVFDYPQISVNFSSMDALNINKHNEPNESFDEIKNHRRSRLPFSSKRECRQSDTLHSKRDTAESETILLPGETDEISEFCDSTMKMSKLLIKISIPVIDVVLESKQIFEIIYNRLNSDLFTWETSSPIFKMNSQRSLQINRSLINMDMSSSLYIPAMSPGDLYDNAEKKKYNEEVFKNIGVTYTDLLSSESVENDKFTSNSFLGVRSKMTESIYCSAHESNHCETNSKSIDIKCSDFSIEITIGKMSMVLFVPVRDMENHVLPEQLGKFDIRVDKLQIFSVSGFQCDNNLGYVCLQLNNIEVYHCGLVPLNAEHSTKFSNEKVCEYMQSTFYPTPNGLTKGIGKDNDAREMVSVVIEMKKLPEQRIKRLKITTGIQGITLRHYMVRSPQSWLNQLIDFLDIKDYPIEGYQTYGIVTEMQLHLWDCAIDYRPENFPFRAVMEIGSFGISSNIISLVTGCNLRFVAEECIFSIAPYNHFDNKIYDFEISFLESTNIVPVFDIGLLDISLRLNENISEKSPKLDLRCSIQDVHLRTCCDSGSALAKLISHFANDGDVINSNVDEDQCMQDLQSSIQSNTARTNETSEIIQKQQEHINSMMAAAVLDTVTSSKEFAQNITKDRGVEIFYFPDENKTSNAANSENGDIESKNELRDILNFENNVMSNSYYSKIDVEEPLPQVKRDLGDVTNKLKRQEQKMSSLDEDFCIIADEDKPFMSQCGVKNVKTSNEPLRMVDNHFGLPTGKPDLLKPPENFPMAQMRYTLCELTITWHLYGGNDFPNNNEVIEDIKKAEKSQMSEAYRYGVSYSKGARGIHFGKKPKEKLTWKTKGGINRNQEVLVEIQFSKVRFSHEVYPPHTSQASRQVLLITDIEIRDRLQSSDINKFLYNLNIKNVSSASPKHMVVVKALHVRPNPERNEIQECSLRISLLPMRLHIDQDTLIFLADYFAELNSSGSTENFQTENNSEISKNNSSLQVQAPIMTIDDPPEAVQDLRTRQLITTNLNILMENDVDKISETCNSLSNVPTFEEKSPIYFRDIIFSPDVSICFDYHGRHVELSRGPITGLLMGLGQLQCSEIILKKIVHRRGLLGIEKLVSYLCKEWLRDIKRNQLPKILSGLGPTHTFVQFFQGIYDLFWLPIEQYQKDGRIIRGLQLGAQSFSARTALAALEITSRIIQLLQFTAETAFDMVSPGPSVRRSRKIKKGKRKRPQRPKDIREGVANAYLIVKEGINDSANTLIETATAEHDQKGYPGAVGAVMRQIPKLVVCPAVLATQATTNILGGVRSSLVPEAKIEAREKWKNDSD